MRFGPFIYWKGEGVFWLRFWAGGPGFKIKDIRKSKMLFSERNGLRKQIKLGPYLFVYIEKEVSWWR